VEGEEGFQVVREPIEVGVHRLVLALVSPPLRKILYSEDNIRCLTLDGVALPALQAVLGHVYGQRVDWHSLTTVHLEQVSRIAKEYEIIGLTPVLTEMYALEMEKEEQRMELEGSNEEKEELKEEEEERKDYEDLDDEELEIRESEEETALEMFDPISVGITECLSDAEIDAIPLVEEDEQSKKIGNDEEEILDTEGEELSENEEECINCGCLACRDGQVIGSTLQLGGKLGCQVAVANCVSSYWGSGYRAQRGEVTKLDSLSTVSVRWVDGSESQYNVYFTEHPDTDSVLCFHCR